MNLSFNGFKYNPFLHATNFNSDNLLNETPLLQNTQNGYMFLVKIRAQHSALSGEFMHVFIFLWNKNMIITHHYL